jgi:diguanylate cyclase (GGDEF)-like protein
MATPAMDAKAVADAEANATLTRILGAIEEYVYTGEFLPDNAYRVLFAGPCRERFLGMSIEQARDAVWADYVHPDWMATFDAAHRGAYETGRLDVEYQLVGADGRVRWVRDRGRMRVEDGRRFLDGSVLDVTAVHSAQLELEAARAEAQRLAQVDHLTGAANRRSLAGRLDRLGEGPVGVLTIDVDHFKQINDLYGHAAGDAVLVSLADRLRESVRQEDDVVRMGGEEFLLLLPGVLDTTALLDVAENVRSDVEAKGVRAGEEDIAVTVSVGAAIALKQTRDVDAARRRRPRALRCQAQRPQLRPARVHRFKIRSRRRGAVRRPPHRPRNGDSRRGYGRDERRPPPRGVAACCSRRAAARGLALAGPALPSRRTSARRRQGPRP